jgi:hypothetical protein
MIPEFVRMQGCPFALLPPGIHWADMPEVRRRFAYNARREWLFEGIVTVAAALRSAGCLRMYLDGSFTTDKDHPGDFDGCWDPHGVDASRLDPVLLQFGNGRAVQKEKFRGEMFICVQQNGDTGTFLDFFQADKFTGQPKGIVGIELQKGSAT